MKLRSIVTAYKFEKVLATEWVLLGILSFFSFVLLHRYVDFDTLTMWSVNLVEVISRGRIWEFYEYTALNLHGVPLDHVGTNIFPLIPWGIWNIPLWIAQRFFEINILISIPAMLWSKLFLVLNLMVTALFTYKIGLLLTEDKAKSTWMAFLTLSSIHVFTGVYYTGQNCITSIMFSVMAVYWLLKSNNKMFLLFSAFAIATKPFFLFPFIAVLLLYEKNLLKTFVSIFAGVSILLLLSLIFWNAPMYQESIDTATAFGETVRFLFQFGIDVQYAHASFFVLGLLSIYVIMYMKNPEHEKEKWSYAIYAIAATYILILVFTYQSFYRYIYFVPFIFILLLSNIRAAKINMLAFGLMSLIISIFNVTTRLRWGFLYVRHLNRGVIDLVFGPELWDAPRKHESVKFLTHQFVPEWSYPALSAVIVFGAALLLIVNYPGYKAAVPFESQTCSRWILWANAFMFAPFLLALLYALLNTI